MPDYPSDEYTDEEEYQDNFVDEQRDSFEGAYASEKKSDSLFSLFRDVWRTKDSSKVANLTDKELGDLNISVRHCQDIALFAKLLGHKGINRYFRRRGEVILATSMSRRMRFAELFVTTKKLAQKGVVGGGDKSSNQKWKIFGKEKATNQNPAE